MSTPLPARDDDRANQTKRFHIGDILSITTGALVSPEHVGGVYKILNWMTGDNLFTHQLPRAAAECAPSLREQFRDLAAVELPDGLSGEGPVYAWLAQQVEAHGEYRDVAPLPLADHTRIDPLTEIAMNYPGTPVVGVVVEDPESGRG